jgi:heat shock protein HslJ
MKFEWVAAVALSLAACSGATPKAPDLQGSNEVTHDLKGTRWALMRLGEKPVTISEHGREAYLHLSSAEDSLVGYAGCNRISGPFTSQKDQLTFGEIIATRMFCEDMPTETALLTAMKATARWQISGSQLQLIDANQQILATFEARDL